MSFTRAPYLTLIPSAIERRSEWTDQLPPAATITTFPGIRPGQRDTLCDVASRVAILERLETIGGLAPSAPLSFVLAKVHGLTEVNRSRGFAAGDVLLRGVSETILRLTRATDLVGRFTGTTFGVVLQGTGATGAAAVAARLTHHLGLLPCVSQPVSVTVSVATGRGMNHEVLPLAAIDSLNPGLEAR